MNLARLVIQEASYRRVNFALSAAVVAVAVFSSLAAVALLRAFDRQTEAMISEMEADTQREMAALEDSIRKSMKGLGFNIYIFPKDQDLGEVYAQGYATKTMPEDYVQTLANSKIVTVNHLLPSLTRKLEWPEQKRTVVLIGIRGEVPKMHASPKKPLLDPVARGEFVLGYELHRSTGVKQGDTVTFQGKTFKVARVHDARGSVDDITIWMNLEECQEMLELQGRINAIQALECNCSTIDRLGEIRKELMAILPETQIIETESTALARAEARKQAKATAEAQMAAKRRQRAELKNQREGLAAILLPLGVAGSLAIIGLLAFVNVRDRVNEIGLLRALGVRRWKLVGAFLARAFAVGLVGAVVACAIGGFASTSVLRESLGGEPFFAFFSTMELGLALLGAPLLACLAAWLPSVLAAQKDPAEVLRNE